MKKSKDSKSTTKLLGKNAKPKKKPGASEFKKVEAELMPLGTFSDNKEVTALAEGVEPLSLIQAAGGADDQAYVMGEAYPIESDDFSGEVLPVPEGDTADKKAPIKSPKGASRSPALLKSSEKALATPDPITSYLNEIRKYPLLSREEELDLAKDYFESKNPDAAQKLVTSNLRFVVKIAAEYSKFGSRLIDLVQEGNVGLMHAVREFNPYKGVRLITYAVWWIRGYIQDYLMRQYSLVRIGTTQNQRKLFYRLQKEKENLDALGEYPSAQLLAEKLGIPQAEVEEMQSRLSGRDLSLDKPIDDDSPVSLLDLQKKADDYQLEEDLALKEQIEILKNQIELLKPELKEKELIILNERILADEPLTLQEIGEKYGITREAVRQAEVRVMNKIKAKFAEKGSGL